MKFSDNDINKFVLLLRKGVYPNECMDDWENFNKATLNEKKNYSNLDMEDITDVDYIHTCIIKVIHYFWLMFSKNSERCV